MVHIIFIFKVLGTQGVLNTVVLFGSNHIYNDYDSWSSVSLPIPSGNTYKFTYYHTAGNPWDTHPKPAPPVTDSVAPPVPSPDPIAPQTAPPEDDAAAVLCLELNN